MSGIDEYLKELMDRKRPANLTFRAIKSGLAEVKAKLKQRMKYWIAPLSKLMQVPLWAMIRLPRSAAVVLKTFAKLSAREKNLKFQI